MSVAVPAAPRPRAGFVVSKAVGGSVVRHRVARRLRHLVAPRLAELPPGTRRGGARAAAGRPASSAELAADLDAGLRAALRKLTGGPRMSGPVVRALVWLLRGYQRYISPALPPTCRFYPSCSAYAIEALQVHGVLGGSWRAVVAVVALRAMAPWRYRSGAAAPSPCGPVALFGLEPS